jgi:PST family polysaccharide transporter
MWWVAWRRLPQVWAQHWRFKWSVALDLLRFGGVVGVARFAGTLLGEFDNFLVGTFVGVGSLGFYDRAYRIAHWPSLLFSNIMTRTAFYTYARLREDRPRLQKSVTMTLWLTTTLAFPLALAIFVTAPDLITLLYGERWLPSVIFLRFLIIYSAGRPIMENASSLFTAVGRPRLTAFTVMLEAAILVVVGVPLTLANGAVGTATAVGIAFGIGMAVRLAFVRHLIEISLWQTIVAPLFVSMVTLVIVYLVSHALSMNDWPLLLRLIAKCGIAVLGYIAILLALQPRVTPTRLRYTWQLLLRRPAVGAA